VYLCICITDNEVEKKARKILKGGKGYIYIEIIDTQDVSTIATRRLQKKLIIK
jgi:hypothetical protein